MPAASQLTMFTNPSLQASKAASTDVAGEQWSPAFASMATPLWVSGLSMALVVAIVQLANDGFHAAFASEFVENWLVMWALAFPVFYMAGASLRGALSYMAKKQEAGAAGTAPYDLASLASNHAGRAEFTVSRNLKVREASYRA